MARVGTKKWRKEKAREIIDRNALDVPFSEADLREFADVTGSDIEGAVWTDNPQFPSDPRHVCVLIDGKWRAWSWNKAIDQNVTPESEAKRVMRFIVREDMKEFKESVKPLECANCGATDNPTVDHANEPFDNIANAFMQQYGVPEIVESDDPNRVIKMFKDMNMEAAWIAFHASIAEYQILCRSCNASKGKR